MRTTSTTVVPLMALFLCAGCESGTDPDTPALVRTDHLSVVSVAGVVLLTQNATDGAGMEALFNGSVALDEAGCLRLESEADYGVAVVWPDGYALGGEAGLDVVDGSGEAVGEIGGEFTLTGGEVQELTDALGFTAADQALAAERCPGRYWIVNAL